MKKGLLVLALLFAVVMPVATTSCGSNDKTVSSPSRWTRTFSDAGVSLGISAEQTADGGYVVVGAAGSPTENKASAYLIKTDDLGKLQWSKTFSNQDVTEANSVQQTSDGGYIIAGVTGASAGKSNVYLVKTDKNGQEQWSKTFGSQDVNMGNSVQQTSDGGYIVAGTTGSSTDNKASVYLIKTDTNGVEQWSKTLGDQDVNEAFSIEQTTNGGYITAGTVGTSGKSNAALFKTDPNGVQQWTRTFGSQEVNILYSVQQTDDGGYIMSGFTGTAAGDKSKVYLVKTDKDGQQQWTNTFGNQDTNEGNSVRQTTDGGYIIGGWTASSTETRALSLIHI